MKGKSWSAVLKSVETWLFSDPNGAPALIRRLLIEYAVPRWKRYAIAMVWMALGGACISGSAYLLGSAINQAIVNRNFPGVAIISVTAMALFTLKGFATYSQTVTMARIGNEIKAENQKRLFEKLLRQRLIFFADRHSSEFAARLGFGAGSVADVIAAVITSLGRDALTLSGLVVVMMVRDPIMATIGIVVMAPAVVTVRHLIKRVRALAEREFGGAMVFLESLQETVQGMRVVKALGLEAELRRTAVASVNSVQQAADKLARVNNRSTPLMEALAGIAVGLVILYGGYSVIMLHAAPGGFVSFIAAFLMAYPPGKRLARLNVDLSAQLVGARIMFEILDLPDSREDRGKPNLSVTDAHLELRNIEFSYRPTEPVLRGLSLIAEAGKTTALVGPSGAGKSTIFNLLLRFYDIQGGAIHVDGQNVTDTSVSSLREQIAYVGQDIFLFRGSIRKNIEFGRLGASEEEIIEAAHAAHAHEFISRFPNGYDTQVGEHGLQLSGGERQRIALARALIRRAPIILLDEPTAQLDSETERYVQEAISHLAEGRTTLVIAHRLYTVMHADMIYVIEDGAVVESGRHDTLMRLNNRYTQFCRLQFGKDLESELSTVAAE